MKTRTSKIKSKGQLNSRRSFLKGATALGAAAALGPWIADEAFSSSGNLNLLTWSGYLPMSFAEKFKSETGITIKQTVVGSTDEQLQKLKLVSDSGYDLVSPSIDQGGRWQDSGLLGTFDQSRIDNSAILPSMLRISESFSWDSEMRHVPFLWGSEALGYRVDKYSAIYGKLSFGDLWRPEMRGKIMVRPHTMMAGIGRFLEGVGEIPPFIEGYSDEDKMRLIWDKILKFSVTHKPWIKKYWNNAEDQSDGFMRGGIVLGQVWENPSQSLFKEGRPVRYLAPREGAFAWLDGLSIPTGAKNIDAIYEFVKFAAQPENGALLANETGYNSAVSGAVNHLTNENKKAYNSAYPDDAIDRLWSWPSTKPWYRELRRQYLQKFVVA